VFKIGDALTRFDIQYFKPSYGLRILRDGSHKDSVEVEESIPVFLQPLLRVLDEFREVNKTTLDNSKLINEHILLLTKNIKSHLKLVNSLILESEVRRLVYEKHSNSTKNKKSRSV
jgi:hypothetical protein